MVSEICKAVTLVSKVSSKMKDSVNKLRFYIADLL